MDDPAVTGIIIVHVPSVALIVSRAGITPPVNEIVCVPLVAVNTPIPGDVEGTEGSVQVYVAAPDTLSPLGRVPGNRFENSTLFIATTVLLFDNVISSCVISLGLIDVGCPVASVTDVPKPAKAELLVKIITIKQRKLLIIDE